MPLGSFRGGIERWRRTARARTMTPPTTIERHAHPMTHPTQPAPRQAQRLLFGLIAVFISDLGVGLLFGFQPPLIALILERQGTSSFAIGAVTSASTIAIIVLGPLYPRLISVLGLRWSVVGGIGLAMAMLMIMPLFAGVPAWMLVRLISGIALGLSWIASEILLNTYATDRNRSTVMAIYATVFGAGVAAGPILLQLTGSEGFTPFLVGALALGASVIPLFFIGDAPPSEPIPSTALSLSVLVRGAPFIMLAALVAGLIESADLSLLPVLGLQQGLGETHALELVTVFLTGNVALQLVIGVLADRFGRRFILGACALVSAIGPLALPHAFTTSGLLWPLLFVWGGTLYGFYTQGIALVGDTFTGHDLTTANTAFVMVYCAGGVLGPSLGGLSMDVWRSQGFVVFVSSAALLLLVGLTIESVGRRRPPTQPA